MSEFKNCPFCGKLIPADESICKYCGKDTANVDTKNDIIQPAIAEAKFNLSDAFSYMFTDKTFISKAIILYVIISISFVFMSGFQAAVQAKITPNGMQILTYIVGFFINLIAAGYSFSCVKALTNQSGEYTLPSFDLMKNFISGFRFIIAAFLIGCVIGPLIAICVAGIAFLPWLLLKVIVLIALLFFVCKYIWVAISFYWLFAHKDYLTLFFKYKLGKKLIANSKGCYAKGVLYLILCGILATAISLIVSITGGILFKGNVMMINILAGLVGTYFIFVYAYIYSKMINPECVKLLE